VTIVSQDALRECGGITSLTLEVNTGLRAFIKCTSLESLTIGEGVTTIGTSAFAYCDALTHIEFPSTLSKICTNGLYKMSFYGADGAKLSATPENLAGHTFEGGSKVFTLVS
jgi:hypothetical protein